MNERRAPDDASDEPNDEESAEFDHFEALTRKLIRMDPPEGEVPHGIGVFMGAPVILCTAHAHDDRLHLVIHAKLELSPAKPNFMQAAEPAVYQLSIDDTEAEEGVTSEHATVEEAKVHAAAETRVPDLDWQPYVGFSHDAG